jgi:hypothetical protein
MMGDVLLTQLRSVARRIAATPVQAEDASIVQQAADRLERCESEPVIPLSEVKEALLGEKAIWAAVEAANKQRNLHREYPTPTECGLRAAFAAAFPSTDSEVQG